jgi:hypothetical protein
MMLFPNIVGVILLPKYTANPRLLASVESLYDHAPPS